MFANLLEANKMKTIKQKIFSLKITIVFFFFSFNKMSSEIEKAYEEWQKTSTVPQYPKKCPRCGTKIRLFHNVLNFASFVCPSKNVNM